MIIKPYGIISFIPALAGFRMFLRVLIAFFLALIIYHSGVIYPQGAKPKLRELTTPKLSVGQWALYEINISKHSPLGSRSYLFKISLTGEEQIEGEPYFWEEVSLISEGVSIIALKKNTYDKPRKVIFKRDGFPALEIDPADIERKLKIDISNIIPGFIAPDIGVNTDGNVLGSRRDGTSGRGSPKAATEKVKYIVPANSEKITCREFTYSDGPENRQVISLVSDDIPIIGLAQSTCVGRDSIITIKLVNFGNRGAKSVIDGKVLKFGEINKQ
jgi:hypothetical protein